MSTIDSAWVSRWAVCLVDPLVDTEDRAEIDHHVAALVGAAPHWWAAYAAGFISDLVATLDPEDPWRSLTVRDGRVLLPNGKPFGNAESFADLVQPAQGDVRADLGLAAVRKPLEPLAAELLATAGTGRARAAEFLKAHLAGREGLGPVEADDFFRITAAAVRFAVHRRREFFGHEDPFVLIDGQLWVDRARRVVAGESLDDGRIARHVANNSVEPGSYRMMAGPAAV
ncbi:hypothetical protein [Sinomonas halotolerans]|uniref:Uncharacterized protein n=1 Tax=Sinomonas halotolerans TaxID=1644133 RepID=A0ABU9WYP8_9MICC